MVDALIIDSMTTVNLSSHLKVFGRQFFEQYM